MEKDKEAQTSYKPYYKKREDNNQSKAPPHGPASMNLTVVGMDNFWTFHQQPHFEKKLSTMDKFNDISDESAIGLKTNRS